MLLCRGTDASKALGKWTTCGAVLTLYKSLGSFALVWLSANVLQPCFNQQQQGMATTSLHVPQAEPTRNSTYM